MTKSDEIEWLRLYAQLENCIREMNPKEVEKVKNYALALKAQRILGFSLNPQQAE